MARVFLTGGSGYIGGALLERLLEQGDQVTALARTETAARAMAARGAEIVPGNVLDGTSALARAIDGCELVLHVAGINTHCPADPGHQLRVNIEGVENVVRAAASAGAQRVVLTSSAASIGEAQGTIGHEGSPHRGSYLSVYDRSKHEGEQAAFAAGRETGIDVVAVNPSSVQGPGRSKGNGAIVIAYANGRLKAFARTHVSLVDVEDTVEGHLLAAQHGAPGERYILNGATITSAEALEVLARVTGFRDRVRMVPPQLARAIAAGAETAYKARGGACPLCRARIRTILHGHRYDGSRATRDLGLEYKSVQETFARTIEWATGQGLVTRSTAVAV